MSRARVHPHGALSQWALFYLQYTAITFSNSYSITIGGRLMAITSVVSFIFLLQFAGHALADHHCEGYDNSQFTDTGKTYQLCWKFDWSTDTITFKVHANTLGWVGFGISPDGHMPGSDVVMGWVKDGSGYFQVRRRSGFPRSHKLPLTKLFRWASLVGSICCWEDYASD